MISIYHKLRDKKLFGLKLLKFHIFNTTIMCMKDPLLWPNPEPKFMNWDIKSEICKTSAKSIFHIDFII